MCKIIIRTSVAISNVLMTTQNEYVIGMIPDHERNTAAAAATASALTDRSPHK